MERNKPMADYEWKECENKLDFLCDIVNGRIDTSACEVRFSDLEEETVYDMGSVYLHELGDIIENKNIKIFKKVIDTE